MEIAKISKQLFYGTEMQQMSLIMFNPILLGDFELSRDEISPLDTCGLRQLHVVLKVRVTKYIF